MSCTTYNDFIMQTSLSAHPTVTLWVLGALHPTPSFSQYTDFVLNVPWGLVLGVLILSCEIIDRAEKNTAPGEEGKKKQDIAQQKRIKKQPQFWRRPSASQPPFHSLIGVKAV